MAGRGGGEEEEMRERRGASSVEEGKQIYIGGQSANKNGRFHYFRGRERSPPTPR